MLLYFPILESTYTLTIFPCCLVFRLGVIWKCPPQQVGCPVCPCKYLWWHYLCWTVYFEDGNCETLKTFSYCTALVLPEILRASIFDVELRSWLDLSASLSWSVRELIRSFCFVINSDWHWIVSVRVLNAHSTACCNVGFMASASTGTSCVTTGFGS